MITAVVRTALAALLLAACSGDKKGEADGAGAPSPERPRPTGGLVRVADQWVDVAAKVLHDPKMDLVTRCRLARDEAKARGLEAPLCFDEAAGAKGARTITRIAVELDQNMARAMRRLTAKNEAAHFVVEKTGGIYQVLDLAYAPRHGESYAHQEVRVIACHEDSRKELVEALVALYPDAKVETTDMTQ